MKSPAQRRKASLANLELARAAIAAAAPEPVRVGDNGGPPLLIAEPQKVLEGYLSMQASATACGVKTRTVSTWMSEPNGLPYVKLGRRTIINLADGREWIASKTKQNNPPRKSNVTNGRTKRTRRA